MELSRSITIMRTSAKYLLDKNVRLKLYYSQYLPSVSCCCEVWGNTYKTNTDCIYLLQKQLARIVSNVHYCHHTNGLSCELHILKLSDFVKQKLPLQCVKQTKSCYQIICCYYATVYDTTCQTRQSKNLRQAFARMTVNAQCISKVYNYERSKFGHVQLKMQENVLSM